MACTNLIFLESSTWNSECYFCNRPFNRCQATIDTITWLIDWLSERASEGQFANGFLLTYNTVGIRETLLWSKSLKSLFLNPSRSYRFFSLHPTALAALKSCEMVSLLLTLHMRENLEWNGWNWCLHFEILATQNFEVLMKLWPLTCWCYM